MSRGAEKAWKTPPVLVPREPSETVGRIALGEGPLLVGREPSCDVVVPQPTVSRRHARLSFDGSVLHVEDLNSSGGTFVNGERIKRGVIAPGDVLRLGPHVEFLAEAEISETALTLAARSRGTEDEVKHLQLVLEVARALNAATVLDEVLEIVLQAAVRLMSADRGWIVLLGSDGTRTAAAVWPRELGTVAGGEQSSLLERAIKERRTTCAGDELSPSTSMVLRGAAMAVAVPMVVARRPLGLAQDASFIATVEAIGGIVVERKARGGAFSSNDLAVLETLAADAAVAIDSARLYREAREKAKIDYEMSLARTIQSALLRKPEQPPFAEVSASSQPARIVGGDLYHTAIRDDGSLAFALGDVSGKGVAAALIMTMIQGLLSVLHELGLDLAEIPEILNRNLALYNPGNRFLTLAMGTLRPDGSVQLVNAGHCPVVILRSAGSTELIQPGGPVLGILPGLQWEVNELHLQPGDSVVIYSDGVSESFSPDRIEFGVEGVARTLEPLKAKSPDDVARLLLEAAVRHRAGREADDDVTIMVVRYRGQA